MSSLSIELSCSFQVSPFSLLKIIISLPLPRIEAKCGISIKTGLRMNVYNLHESRLNIRKIPKTQRDDFEGTLNRSINVYPKKVAPTGPISMTRVARASPSIRGGGFATLLGLISLHVTRIGIVALRGGTIMRTPLCLHPFIAPPRASTKKLTKNLKVRRSRMF